MKKISLLWAFFLLAPILLPLSAKAEALFYTRISNATTTKALFQAGGLENKNYYLCDLVALSCNNLGSTTDKTTNDLFKEETSPYLRKINRLDESVYASGATRVTISPAGNFLAYYLPAKTSNETIKTKSERKHILVDMRETEAKKYEISAKLAYWDLLSEDLKVFSFSPDESRLVYLDDKNGPPSLYSIDLTKLSAKSLPGTRLITKSYSVSDFMFWDKDTLYFAANRENPYRWSLYEYKFSTGAVKKIADDISYAQSMRKAGDSLLFLQIKNNAVLPALYNPLTKKLSYFDITPSREITVLKGEPVTLAGIPGVLVKPKNFSATKSYPLLVWLHGGPYRQAAAGIHPYLSYGVYDWILNEAAKNGVMVLKLDYRGSYGFGRPYAESIKHSVGIGDVKDVTSAIEALKAKYKIGKVYLEGNSYGGYLAMRTVVEKPSLFAGAFSINGVTDWGTLLNRLDSSIFNVHFGGLVDEENEKDFMKAAIVNKVAKLNGQKIVIAQAAEDKTVAPDQADLLYYYLSKAGKATDIVKYKEEDHVFHKTSSIEDLCRRTLEMLGTSTAANCLFK